MRSFVISWKQTAKADCEQQQEMQSDLELQWALLVKVG